MQQFYFLRHGMTEWNQKKRIQGRTDIPLCPEGVAQMQARAAGMDPAYRLLDWYSSPLARARQTAALLQLDAATDPALIEMNWGDWEGHTLAELRHARPDAMALEEARGLQMTPPQGESPARVLDRISHWAAQISHPAGIGCISHKGVIRAVYAAAADWDMQHKAPHKLDYNCLQQFGYANGRWYLQALNLPLDKMQ
ncbi:histidine phosphatase family protein [Neptuniibacter halophilus]|uniref:histidine phosphatase family protein n=1 Tax=Neptuniibacter halophilus TaxID=651666 RepID=UPI0025729FB5|nr:histidine phosphatase family protein [Neptuniibacter halophilus]